MLKKTKHNNSKIYLTIYNKMVDNLILKFLNVLTCLSSLIQTKKQRVILNTMEEEAILEDNHLEEAISEEAEVAQAVLEVDSKVELLQAVQGIKKHPCLLAIQHTRLILMK